MARDTETYIAIVKGHIVMLFENISVLDQEYQVRENMFLATEGSRIEWLDKAAPSTFKGPRVSCAGKLAVPGFFNLHCHVPMTLLRGYGEGLPLHRWLHERIFPFEALLDNEDVYWGAILGIAEMLKSGVVSFTDMYFKIAAIAKAVDESGIKANLCCGAVQDDVCFEKSEAYQETRALTEYLNSLAHDRIRAEIGIHAEYTSDENVYRDVAGFAKENSMALQVHLSETAKEHEECKQRHGGLTPAGVMLAHGVFDVPATAAHCVMAEPGDMDIFVQKGVSVAHCPSSNLKLGSGVMPMKQLLEKGVHVCIGTDGAASNNNLNMLEEINLAAMLHRGANHDSSFPSMAQMVEMACANGAQAQRRLDCGNIATGNRADIVIFDLDKPHLQPAFDPLANILFSAQSEDIWLTMVDGRVLYQNGEYKTIDIEQVLYHAKRIQGEKVRQLHLAGAE